MIIEKKMASKNMKIFVGNVPFQCTKKEFMECFNKYEGFIDGDIVNKINSDSSRGFGFITFDTSFNADNFLATNENVILKDRILRFTKYDNNDKKIYKNRFAGKNYMFVKNIPKATKPDDIKQYFSVYGKVGACFINTNIQTGESKVTAVVEILDNNTFNKLLSSKTLLDNKYNFEISRWKQRIKIKKSPSSKFIAVLSNDIN